ncbi:MAG: cytochrome c maturation protein CcmE [Acidimicrobiia bacterium]|nr:cytochrome c maturation protein CcmE [Acidimicrobiia bacterium]
MSPRDDAESTDAAEVDLTPRDPRERGRRRWPAIAAIVVVLAAVGFVLARGLGDATLYFYNADEAVEQRGQLGDDRFRLQGTVARGSVSETADGVSFTVTHDGADVRVDHVGDPPQLFQEGIPVVVEGNWSAGDVVTSDHLIVKHSEVYEEQNPERVSDAAEEAGPAS